MEYLEIHNAYKESDEEDEVDPFSIEERGDFDLHMKNEKPPMKYFQNLTPIVLKHG